MKKRSFTQLVMMAVTASFLLGGQAFAQENNAATHQEQAADDTSDEYEPSARNRRFGGSLANPSAGCCEEVSDSEEAANPHEQ